jgi:hypothetical protein
MQELLFNLLLSPGISVNSNIADIIGVNGRVTLHVLMQFTRSIPWVHRLLRVSLLIQAQFAKSLRHPL